MPVIDLSELSTGTLVELWFRLDNSSDDVYKACASMYKRRDGVLQTLDTCEKFESVMYSDMPRQVGSVRDAINAEANKRGILNYETYVADKQNSCVKV